MGSAERKRIALVNQRYGVEVNGGSEHYTRQLAEHLCQRYDVEVLTTKSLDYHLWDNHYQEDVEIINGVTVIRFPIVRSKNQRRLERLDWLLRRSPLGSDLISRMWIDEFGPLCPGIASYIRQHADEYCAFIFVTYMYYPAITGIPLVPDKSILIPTAHDDPYINLPHYRPVFQSAHALGYLTEEEESLVESVQDVAGKPHCIVGCGVDVPAVLDNDAFREKYGITGNYVVYVGRIGPEKGCDRMVDAFTRYCERYGSDDLTLVLIGRGTVDIPDSVPIKCLGFVPEQDKFDAISGARALWLPSQFESLSIAVLEAFSLGVPILVNGKCEVLRGHCDKSHAGWAYSSEDEAASQLRIIATLANLSEMAQNAKRYISENYTWEITLKRLTGLIEQIDR